MMPTNNIPLDKIRPHWAEITPYLAPPQTERDYERLVSLLNEILDSGGADEKHALAGLADYIGSLVAEWEEMMLPTTEQASGKEMLQHLMTENGLHQADLPALGSQGVVSEILSGKRELNLRQIRALAERFDVPVQWFV